MFAELQKNALFFLRANEKKCKFVGVKHCAYIALFVLSLLGLFGVCGRCSAPEVPTDSVVQWASVSCYSDDCYTQGGSSELRGSSTVSPSVSAPTLWHTSKTIDSRGRRFFINHNAISFKAGRLWSCCLPAVQWRPFGLLPMAVKHHAQFFIRLCKLTI